MRATRRLAILVAADSATLLAARTIVQSLRETTTLGSWVGTLFPPGLMGGGAWAAWILGLALVGAYGTHERWASPSKILAGSGAGAAIELWQSIDVLGLAWVLPRWLVLTASVALVLSATRAVLWALVMRYKVESEDYERVLFVGDHDSAQGRATEAAIIRRPGVASLGWLSERGERDDYLGHPSAVWNVLSETEADTVVVSSELGRPMFEAVAEAAAVAGCRLLAVHDRGPLVQALPRQVRSGPVRLLELTFPAARVGHDVLKRAFDLVACTAGLVLISPLLASIALWIKLDSPGPVFFRQERVGHAGRIFRMWKFRSMTADADRKKGELAHLNESGDSRLFKIPNDPRITTAGATLRRWSLDELPQLFNVLAGQMSLVGPRPFFESDLADYDDHHFIRLAVRPGVTGLWQVKGRSSIVDFEEVVRLDKHYVETWSLWLDLKILFATVPAVLRRTGAH